MRWEGRTQEEGAEGIDGIGDIELTVIICIAGCFTGDRRALGEKEQVQGEDGIRQVEGQVAVAIARVKEASNSPMSTEQVSRGPLISFLVELILIS